MECLMHQVLVAMLSATPVPDPAPAAKVVDAQPRAAVAAPAKARKPKVVLGKSKSGVQIAQVTLPRGAALN